MTTVALIGNPNSGKTTLFNRLTGSSQRVGNWPGVTVERKVGKIKGMDGYELVDLPGIYSLSPYSPEEVVTRNYFVQDPPNVLINIVDASNLERNLYLTVQLLDYGIPMVLALNMVDIAEQRGIKIDCARLAEMTGCEVVPMVALKGDLTGLKDALRGISGKPPRVVELSKETESYIARIEKKTNNRSVAVKLLERDELSIKENPAIWAEVESIVKECEDAFDDTSDSVIAHDRYEAIGKVVAEARTVASGSGETTSDRLDRIITSKWLGLPIFVGIMFLIYYVSIQTIGGWATEWVNTSVFEEWAIPGSRGWLESLNVEPALVGLVSDGIIAGVGAVLGFLPQILVLFVLITILEDCGYMARVSFVMDRVFRRFNLSGKSFIPLLVGTGCGIPGVMATRTIENENDRKITAMTTTFMPCSAKLPIIAGIAGALFGGSALIAVFCYFLGITCVLISGIIIKKWNSFKGSPSVFIMELPPYHVPRAMNVIKTTLDRGWGFVKKAGTFILLACALIWFLSNFDWSLAMLEPDHIDQSMLAGIGNALTWIFVPLGWGQEWEFTVATITGLLAKETVISTFGVLFSGGWEEAVAAILTPAAALSFLAFNMICAPCFAAIGAIRKELESWKMTGVAVAYQCVLAYAVALIVYNFGTLLSGEITVWLIAAVAAVIVLVYVLVAKDPFRYFGKKKEAASC